MKIRRLSLLAGLGAACFLAGCNGPTKAGLEARADARDRLAAFSSKFTYDQAMQDFRSGRLESAHRNLDAAIAKEPENARFHMLKGRVFLEQNQLNDALVSFIEATTFDDTFADPHYFIGIVNERWSDDEAALAGYKAAFELDSDRPEYLAAVGEVLIGLGRYEEARALIEINLDHFEHSASLRHLLAQVAILEGDSERGAELLAEACLIDPENELLIEELAYAEYDAARFGSCLDTLTAIKVRKGELRLDLRHIEARCLTMLGRTKDAFAAYYRLTQDDPGNVSTWIEYGTLAWKLEDFRRVAKAGERAMGLAPARYEGYMLSGLYQRSKGNFAEAVDLLTQAADRAEDSPLPCLLLASALEQSGNVRSALAVCDETVTRFPASTDARALRERLAERMGTASAG